MGRRELMARAYSYTPANGVLYAQSFAIHEMVPVSQQLFFYDEDDDCTNFISQCVWAAYGGWIPGFMPDIVSANAQRIKKDVRQVGGIWYGSKNFIGSNKWCRVVEFYDYVTLAAKKIGPMADKIAEGDWNTVDPGILAEGDVIQLVVATYTAERYGHGLYVTQKGNSWDQVRICCHTYDRLNEPMNSFSEYPDIYRELRVLRFRAGYFE